jgi:hypothetical protein
VKEKQCKGKIMHKIKEKNQNKKTKNHYISHNLKIGSIFSFHTLQALQQHKCK